MHWNELFDLLLVSPNEVKNDPIAVLYANALELLQGDEPTEKLVGLAKELFGHDSPDVSFLDAPAEINFPPLLSAFWFYGLTNNRISIHEGSTDGSTKLLPKFGLVGLSHRTSIQYGRWGKCKPLSARQAKALNDQLTSRRQLNAS